LHKQIWSLLEVYVFADLCKAKPVVGDRAMGQSRVKHDWADLAGAELREKHFGKNEVKYEPLSKEKLRK
jgi:hypothetical protein